MSSPIFDRADMVQLLKDTCLAEGGTSSAITCTQKTGKSYLLRHLYESHAEQFAAGQRVIFCSLSVDLLQSMIQSQSGNPDQAFLLFFCQRLQDQLETWVDNLSRGETDRKTEIQDLAQKAATATGNFQQALILKRDSLQLQQVELDRLRTILALLDPLANGSRPIDILMVARVLDKLKRIQKRVILIIDDFTRMLNKKDLNLSDAVFNFLRGASNDKTLVTLVASNLHPMDPELHDNSERPSLVNHFQVQPLAPFTEEQSAEFLNWLSRPWIAQGRAPLDADQIAYLVNLGGGCPFFLEIAYRMFEMDKRPVAADRTVFENRDVVPLFEPAFRQVWKRCSEEQRTMLREIANGNAVTTGGRIALSLQREGYIVISGAAAQLFSRLFASFAGTALNEPPPQPEIKYVLNYKVFPTALAISQPSESHPLISFTVNNPTGGDIKVTLEAELMQYTNRVPRLVGVRRRNSELAGLKFTLQNTFPVSYDARYGDFAYSAWLELPGGGRTPLANDVAQMRILPVDTFVFARRDADSRMLIDWSWMIAAWVSKNNPAALNAILQQARQINGGQTPGYAISDDVRSGVRAQVEALYEAVRQSAGISYDDSATVFHLDGNDYAQRVRLPHRSLRDKAANCLDGSVLFASLLATIGLHPIILLLPRHAIVGWKQEDSPASDLEFLETTMLAKKNFAEAHAEGMRRYAEVKGIADAWQYTGEIPDAKQFAIPIDVEKEWSLRQVASLPWN